MYHLSRSASDLGDTFYDAIGYARRLPPNRDEIFFKTEASSGEKTEAKKLVVMRVRRRKENATYERRKFRVVS